MAIASRNDPAYEYVDEIESMIRRRFPNAKFRITPMPDDHEGVAIWAYTDADEEDVREVVRSRELELLLDRDIYLGTIPMPIEDWRD